MEKENKVPPTKLAGVALTASQPMEKERIVADLKLKMEARSQYGSSCLDYHKSSKTKGRVRLEEQLKLFEGRWNSEHTDDHTGAYSH